MTKPKGRPKGPKNKLKSASPHEAPHPVFSTPWAILATRLLVPKAGYPHKPTAITLWRRAEPGVRDAIQEEVKRRADLAAAEDLRTNLDASESANGNGMGKQIKAKDARRKNFALQESIAREMFAELKLLEQEAWNEAAEEEYKEAVSKWEEEGKVKEGVEERRKYIETLPEFLDWYSKNISQDTGCAVSFIAGGPDPSENGKLNIVGVHQGHLPNDPQANFGVVHWEEYEDSILKDYGNYLRERYSGSTPNEPCLPASSSSLHTTTTTVSLETNSEPSAPGSSGSGSITGEYRVISASPQIQAPAQVQAGSPTQPRALQSVVKPAMNVTVDSIDLEPQQEDSEMDDDEVDVGAEPMGMAGVEVEHEYKGEGKKDEPNLARTYRANYPELEGLLKSWNFDLQSELGSGEVKTGPAPRPSPGTGRPLTPTASSGPGSEPVSDPFPTSASTPTPSTSTTSSATTAAPNTDSCLAMSMDALVNLDIEVDDAVAADVDAGIDIDMDLEDEVPVPNFQTFSPHRESGVPALAPAPAPVCDQVAMDVDVSSSSKANPPDLQSANGLPVQDGALAKPQLQGQQEPRSQPLPSDCIPAENASADIDKSNGTPNSVAFDYGHDQTRSQIHGVHVDSSSSSSSKSKSNPDGGGQTLSGSRARAPIAQAPASSSTITASKLTADATPAPAGSGAPASVSAPSIDAAPDDHAAGFVDTDATDVDVAHPGPGANSNVAQSVEGFNGPSSSQLVSSVASSSAEGPSLPRADASMTSAIASVNGVSDVAGHVQDQGRVESTSIPSSAARSGSDPSSGGQAGDLRALSAQVQPVSSSVGSTPPALLVPSSTSTPSQDQPLAAQAQSEIRANEPQTSGPSTSSSKTSPDKEPPSPEPTKPDSEKQITLEGYDLSGITENDEFDADDAEYEAEMERFYNGDDDYEDEYEDDFRDYEDDNGYPDVSANPVGNMFMKFLDSMERMNAVTEAMKNLDKRMNSITGPGSDTGALADALADLKGVVRRSLLGERGTGTSSTKKSSPPPVASSSKVTLDSSALSDSSKAKSSSTSKSDLRTPYSEPLDVDRAVRFTTPAPGVRILELPKTDEACDKVMFDWDDDFYGQTGKGKASAGSGLGSYSAVDVPELYVTRPTPSPPRVRSSDTHSCANCAPHAPISLPLESPTPSREQSPLRDVVDPIFRLTTPRPLLFIGPDISDGDRLKVPPKAYTRKHRDAMAYEQSKREKKEKKAQKKAEKEKKKEKREREKAKKKELAEGKSAVGTDKQKDLNGAARQEEKAKTQKRIQVQAAVPTRPVSVTYPNEASTVENVADLIDRASAHVRSVTANVNRTEAQVEPPRDAPLPVSGRPALALETPASKARSTEAAGDLPDGALTNGKHADSKAPLAEKDAAFLSPPAPTGLVSKAALRPTSMPTSMPTLVVPEATPRAGQKMSQVGKQGASGGTLVQKPRLDDDEFYQDDIPADPDVFATLLRKPDPCMDIDEVHDLGEEHNGVQEALSPARRSKRKRGSEVISAPPRVAISSDETPASRKSKRLRAAGSPTESVSISTPIPRQPSSTSSKSSKRRQSSAGATTSPRVAVRRIPSVPAADPSAPQYFQNAIQMFTSSDQASFGSRWTSLVSLWSSFEASWSFKEIKGLGKANRPQVIADWIARARSATWRPNIVAGDPELKKFEGQFRKWWVSLQPQWRIVDEGKGELVREVSDEGGNFDELRLPGKNGVVSVLAALFYWGLAVRNKSPKARAHQKWLEAVEDCHWVFEQLVGPSH